MDFEQKKIFGSTGQNDPQGLSLKIHNYVTETKSLRSFWPGHQKKFLVLNSFREIMSIFGTEDLLNFCYFVDQNTT